MEITIALMLTLLSFPPFGQLTIHVCPVKLLSDFYPIFHNPTVNYRKKLRCSYEVVYPLYVLCFFIRTSDLLIELYLGKAQFSSCIHMLV